MPSFGGRGKSSQYRLAAAGDLQPNHAISLNVFTGLVEAIGTLRESQKTREGLRFGIQHPLGQLELGESVAINGVCLTVVESNTTRFVVDVSQETLQVTALSRASTGCELNLERALRLGDRLGGHLVSGHVDGLAQVRSLKQAGQASAVEFSAPTALLVFVATKGSVTLDGVSLTVNRVSHDGFEVMLIPHTRAVTTLGKLAIGSQVNLEVDLLARYVCRYLDMRGLPPPLHPAAASAGLAEALKRSGLM